jgi:Fe-S-cluster-containing dehydrogenase component
MTRKLARRDFLKIAAAGATAATTARVIGRAGASDNAVAGVRQWAMVIDQSKCLGCDRCTLACQATNNINPDIEWNQVSIAGEVAGKTIYLPRPCMHCAKAPCVDVCPVGASYYRDDGIVMMDYDRCIGCRYCETACPYEARSFNWKTFDGPNPAVPKWGTPEVERRPRGVVEKCTFCRQRIDRGLSLGLTPGVDPDATPACCVACPTGARTFGDLNDPDSTVSALVENNVTYRLRDELGTEPRVYYIAADPAKMEE